MCCNMTTSRYFCWYHVPVSALYQPLSGKILSILKVDSFGGFKDQFFLTNPNSPCPTVDLKDLLQLTRFETWFMLCPCLYNTHDLFCHVEWSFIFHTYG
jgi:hypothetical protein